MIQSLTLAQDLATSSQTIIVTAQQAYLLCFFSSTSSALLLGNPVHHALYLRAENPLYARFDNFGGELLNDPSHASHSRTQSHDHNTSLLADLATQHGLATLTKHVPFADYAAPCRSGDLPWRASRTRGLTSARALCLS